ncbi:MAG: hydrogenase maturation nickel metallochaperone HypA [Synechococcales bacterium]|nr:hydrogenase maturation nickel metallochaperone HypA [Synechococcales bacterium]
MHELGITQNIVAIASEHAQGARVQRLSLEIGQLTAILPDAIRFCFDVCAQGTVLEGATLEILETPGLGQCRECGHQLPLSQPFGVCVCGSTRLDIIQGQELLIKELETEVLCA